MKRLLFVMSVALVLSGCATSKEELLPAGEQTMLELWQGKTAGGGQRHALAARERCAVPYGNGAAGDERGGVQLQPDAGKRNQPAVSTSAESRHGDVCVSASGRRYVAGSGLQHGISFYSRTQYALPGERTEAL